jgi:hypothetical protein
MKFWLLTIPAFRAAQKADGILLCENKSRNGYQHTLTVWKTKAHMLAYVRSPKHMKAMRAFPSIAIGRLLSYESDIVPSWDEALLKWEREAKKWLNHIQRLNLGVNALSEPYAIVRVLTLNHYIQYPNCWFRRIQTNPIVSACKWDSGLSCLLLPWLLVLFAEMSMIFFKICNVKDLR